MLHNHNDNKRKDDDMIRNLGKALSILAKHEAEEIMAHADVDLWGAPSECHDLVAKGEEQRARQARRHAESVARRPFRIIMYEACKRGMLQSHWYRLIDCHYHLPL